MRNNVLTKYHNKAIIILEMIDKASSKKLENRNFVEMIKKEPLKHRYARLYCEREVLELANRYERIENRLIAYYGNTLRKINEIAIKTD